MFYQFGLLYSLLKCKNKCAKIRKNKYYWY